MLNFDTSFFANDIFYIIGAYAGELIVLFLINRLLAWPLLHILVHDYRSTAFANLGAVCACVGGLVILRGTASIYYLALVDLPIVLLMFCIDLGRPYGTTYREARAARAAREKYPHLEAARARERAMR